jgi:hypothetical protein
VVRVTSALWVAALTRRAYGEGAPAAVVRKGAEEAGAIFVIVDRLDGTSDLYGPAPQSLFDDEREGDRLFQRLVERGGSEAVAERIEREKKFDPDLWVIAVEDRAARTFFDTV